MKKVVVGLSGGVDSSVAAYLLKEAGHEVIGLFMKNWDEISSDGQCHATQDFEDAAKVAEILNIPFYSVNFVQEYWDGVFSHFVEELKQGYTPNPDILCNREIKFRAFFEKALQLGADYLATGHYCQTREGRLFKGADPNKDQSYFLYTLKNEVLERVLFPIGHLTKPQVREIAKIQGLPTSDKRDSTGICFIGKRNFKKFISEYIPYHPGNFETLAGEVVGQHDGAAYYTIGQRKGLGIGGPGDAWFVIEKDMARNVVIIEQGSDHPALYSYALKATDLSFVCEKPPTPLPFHCKAKVRYRQQDEPCKILSLKGDQLEVAFENPQRAITPRQSVVLYDGELCLGGAMIEQAFQLSPR